MALKFVRSNIDFLLGLQEPRLATVNTRKLVWVGHVTRQPLQNHPSGHLVRWATLWLAEEMLDGQHQRADIPAYAKIAGIKTDQFLSVLRHV